MANVNIGGDVADMSYRYKMPRLQTKIEGRGNGIKTVIVNMVDIAKALHTDPRYPTKYFGIELGALSSYDKKSEKSLVNGSHQASDLADILSNFVDAFILCPSCKLPEIRWAVTKRTIKIDCAACGHNGELLSTHRLTTYIMKNPPGGSKSSDKKKDKKKKKKKKKSRKDKELEDMENKSQDKTEADGDDDDDGGGGDNNDGGDDDDDNDVVVESTKSSKKGEIVWHSDTSKEASIARKRKEFEEMKSEETLDRIVQSATSSSSKDSAQEAPDVVLRHFVLSERGNKTENIVSELKRVQISRGLDDSKGMQALIKAFLGDDNVGIKELPKILEKRSTILKSLNNGRQEQLIIIYSIGHFLATQTSRKYLALMPHMLKVLFEQDVVDEENIIFWYESPSESDWIINKTQGKDLRDKSKVFVEWLKNAEESESDDDDDSENDQ